MPNYKDFERRVFLLQDQEGRCIGTGFSVGKPRLVLTGKHNLSRYKNIDKVSVWMILGNEEVEKVALSSSIVFHPSADLAAIIIPDEGQECFEMESQYCVSLGTDVESYGFCLITKESELYSQYFKGYVQRFFEFEDKKFFYLAMQMSFPVFGGQSGSPILLKGSNKVVGLITNTRCMKETRKIDNEDRTIAIDSYSFGVYFPSVSDWIEKVAKET